MIKQLDTTTGRPTGVAMKVLECGETSDASGNGRKTEEMKGPPKVGVQTISTPRKGPMTTAALGRWLPRGQTLRSYTLRRFLTGIAIVVLAPSIFAQILDTTGVENRSMSEGKDQVLLPPFPSIIPSFPTLIPPIMRSDGLLYIAITPCRIMDTRHNSGKTGAFGPPSLVAGSARTVPVPSSKCGVPEAAAYSMNFVSVTPPGRLVGWIAAWPDHTPWPGTVVLNAPLGGTVDNSAIVGAGADGGIQLLTSNNGDLVIYVTGYFVRAATAAGPVGPAGKTGPMGPAGLTGAAGAIGPQGLMGNTGAASTVAGPAGLTGAAGAIGPQGPIGNTGAASTVAGPAGLTGAAGAIGPQGPTGNTGAASTVAGPAGPTGAAGAIGPQGPIGNTGAASTVAGPAGLTGAAGAIGPQGLIGNTGAASTVAGPTGLTGAAGAIGPQGPIGNTGAASTVAGPTGLTGAAGAIGPQGLIGNTGAASTVAGPTGLTGAAGAIGPQGPSGLTGSIAFADFFALMPGDNAATVGIGTDVSFPQNGPSSSSTITRASDSAFNLSAVGTYQIMFQVSVDEPGQLNLTLNGSDLAYTVVGRVTRTSQIVGMSLVTTTVTNSILTVRNPADNTTALTITPIAGGTMPVSAHLVITQIQ